MDALMLDGEAAVQLRHGRHDCEIRSASNGVTLPSCFRITMSSFGKASVQRKARIAT